MLTGKELGKAIRKALEAKGISPSQAAARYSITKASVSGWFGTGRIKKETLFDLMGLCSDVLGPEHWGMTCWPELSNQSTTKASEPKSVYVVSKTSQADSLPEWALQMARAIAEIPRDQLGPIEMYIEGYRAAKKRPKPKANRR